MDGSIDLRKLRTTKKRAARKCKCLEHEPNINSVLMVQLSKNRNKL